MKLCNCNTKSFVVNVRDAHSRDAPELSRHERAAILRTRECTLCHARFKTVEVVMTEQGLAGALRFVTRRSRANLTRRGDEG